MLTLPIGGSEAPSNGWALFWSATDGRYIPRALSGAALSGFTNTQIAVGAIGGGLAGSTGLTWDGSTLADGGALTVAGGSAGGVAMFGGALSTAIRFSFGSLTVPPSWATGTVQNGFLGQFCATSACTGRLVCITSRPGTDAQAFTCGVVEKFFAQLTNLGAGSAVTRTFGFINRPDTSGVTSNVGFFQGQETDAISGNWALYFNTTDNNELGGGNTLIGSPTLATSATDGFLHIPGCAGTPTGTPTSFSGRVPMCIDTTNNRLYFYSGGAWRNAGP